mmetsp:Transcript_52776/g.78227  ORF Transcript_52776/g.78227 Transcript_52776/m.78227 type:complete len:90 (-) Transcript_52776:529-798(-)
MTLRLQRQSGTHFLPVSPTTTENRTLGETHTASASLPLQAKSMHFNSIQPNAMQVTSFQFNSISFDITTLHNTSHYHITLPFRMPLDSF